LGYFRAMQPPTRRARRSAPKARTTGRWSGADPSQIDPLQCHRRAPGSGRRPARDKLDPAIQGNPPALRTVHKTELAVASLDCRAEPGNDNKGGDSIS